MKHHFACRDCVLRETCLLRQNDDVESCEDVQNADSGLDIADPLPPKEKKEESSILLGRIQSVQLRHIGDHTLAVSIEIDGRMIEIIRSSSACISHNVSRARIIAEIEQEKKE